MSEENLKIKSKKKIYIIIGIIAVAVILASIYFYSINKAVESWGNKIYPSVTVNGIDIGGKTKEEAQAIVEVGIIDKIKNKKLILESKGQQVIVEYSKISPKYDISEAVDKAVAYGKDKSVFVKNSYIKRGADSDIQIKLMYDEKMIDYYKKELESKVNKNPTNATINIQDENIKVIEGKDGEVIDTKDMDILIAQNITGDIKNMESKISISTVAKKPDITAEMLKDINSKLSTASTNFNSGDWSRTTNLKVATNNINGTILMPGETFSYNEVVGERTVERGFKEGAAFEGGRVVPSIGGGVCQISTTLYKSIMGAGIMSTERYNHTMSVSYADPSEDATVAWGYLDYKFKNTYDSPIYIQGQIEENTVTFNIYGDINDLGGKTYEIVGVRTGTINPGNKRINDSSMPVGTQVIETRPQAGVTSNGYLVTYKDGKEISRKLISKDIYNSTEGVIRYGTGAELS